MAATINASTSAGVVTTADTSGNLNLQSNGTTIIGYTSTGVTVTGTLTPSGVTRASGGLNTGPTDTTPFAAGDIMLPSSNAFRISYSGYAYSALAISGGAFQIDAGGLGTTFGGSITATGSSGYGPRANASSTGRVSVGTGATTLSALSSGGSVGATVALFIVNGYNTGGSGNSFCDIVSFVSNAGASLISAIAKGSPAARTYSASGGSFQLAMASGTYNVSVTQFEQSC